MRKLCPTCGRRLKKPLKSEAQGVLITPGTNFEAWSAWLGHLRRKARELGASDKYGADYFTARGQMRQPTLYPPGYVPKAQREAEPTYSTAKDGA